MALLSLVITMSIEQKNLVQMVRLYGKMALNLLILENGRDYLEKLMAIIRTPYLTENAS